MVFGVLDLCRVSMTMELMQAKPTFGDKACPHCNTTISDSYSQYLFSLTIYNNLDTIVRRLENKDFNDLFEFAEAIIIMHYLH